jgi:hypothetical protein
MAWWSTPQQQEDEQRTAPMPLLPVDPDSPPSTEEDGPLTRFPPYPLDEDGWPILPPQQDDWPPIWK